MTSTRGFSPSNGSPCKEHRCVIWSDFALFYLATHSSLVYVLTGLFFLQLLYTMSIQHKRFMVTGKNPIVTVLHPQILARYSKYILVHLYIPGYIILTICVTNAKAKKQPSLTITTSQSFEMAPFK